MTGSRPFPYPGSKARMAPWIIKHMAAHERYVEVFGGAAAILFSKPRSPTEVYNDFDGDLANFFEVLRDQPDELTEWLTNAPFSREQHEEWAEEWYVEGERSDDSLERAGRFFYLRYSQWNGKHGDKTELQHRGGKKANEYARAIDRIPEFAERMKGVMVEALDYQDLMEQYDGEDTLFYLDPDLSGWTTEDLFVEDCSLDPQEFIEFMDGLEGRWQVSLLDKSLPDEWVGREDRHVRSKTFGNFNENIVMNYDPMVTMSVEGDDQTIDAMEGW